MKKHFFYLVFFFLSLMMLIFIVVPIIVLYVYAKPETIFTTLFNVDFFSIVYRTFMAGIIATLVLAGLGIPLGYLMARVDFRGKSVLQGVIDLPLVIPDTVAGIIVFLSFYRGGVFGQPLSTIGLEFVDAFPGIVVAMMFVGAPFVVNTSKAGFLAIDPKLERVAMSLGASRFKTFFSISLPLNAESIWNALIITWSKGVAGFGSIIIIAYFPEVAPTYIYNSFLLFGLSAGSAAAGAYLLLTLIIFVISRYIANQLTRWTK